MKHRRLCDDWIETYLKWSLDRSEVTASQIVWSGLFTLSSVMRRRVKFPAKYMGGYEIFPNLYIIYVADPGKSRKSTTMGFSTHLIKRMNNRLPMNDRQRVSISSDATSQSALVQAMSQTQDGTITVLAKELGSFMMIGGDEMYNFLTDIFDPAPSYEYRTRAHKLERIEDPCLNFFGATTPHWMQDNMPYHAIGGGFASRVIFVYEDSLRQRRLYYDHLDMSQYDQLEGSLVQDLIHMISLEGEFRHDSTATKDLMEEWYVEEGSKGVEDPRLTGYFQRKPLHVHKVAMLLSLAEGDDLVIQEHHFTKALKLLEAVERKMGRAFLAVGLNTQAGVMVRVVDYIGMVGGTATRAEITNKFSFDMPVDEMMVMLNGLIIQGVLKRDTQGENPVYRLIGSI